MYKRLGTALRKYIIEKVLDGQNIIESAAVKSSQQVKAKDYIEQYILYSQHYIYMYII